MSLKIAVLVGTNRPGSNSRKIAVQLRAVYEKLGAEVLWLDLGELPPEVFSPTVYAEKSASFKRFSQAVLDADGLHVIVPEYNGSMPGILKYFIDLLKFPESFEHKPVAYIGLGNRFGGLRPVEHLMQVFSYRNGHNFPVRVFLHDIKKLMDTVGLQDTESLARIEKQSADFLVYVAKLKN
jgi:NAD(P)H-dependent FMN reductase